MRKENFVIVNECGLHMRPAMLMVETAQKFKSKITIIKEHMEADAKSIMMVSMLAVVCGEEIQVVIKGKDEDEAMSAIEELIKNNFELVEAQNEEI